VIPVLKRELVGFFKNPAAYLILTIYAFLSGLFFCLSVVLADTSYLGELFGLYLFFVEIIVVAALSMRFFSEEKKNRTDQLLYTTPVSISGIVFGKFLGGMTVYAACTAINLVYIFIVAMFGTPDVGMNISNLVGTMLLGACMVSVALLMSSLTENGIVAAISTVGVYILLFLADVVASFLYALLPSWLTWLADGLTKLNLFQWYANFEGGILRLDAVVFYLSFTAVFLFLTARVIERRRWR